MPTRAYSHDPSVYGELKEWLDGVRADIEQLGNDGELVDVAFWIRRVCKGGKDGFNDVARALVKQGYGDLWAMLLDMSLPVHQRCGLAQ